MSDASLLEADLSGAIFKYIDQIRLFFSYESRDRTLRDRLEEHLSNLKYRELITTWSSKEISAGQEYNSRIDSFLNTSHIVLLLISASFLASEQCYEKEMLRAIVRYKQGEIQVFAVLLRPVLFTDAPFARLPVLPSNGKPVTSWRDRESAFVDIAIGIENIALRLKRPKETLEQQESRGSMDSLFSLEDLSLSWDDPKQRYYIDALVGYEKALLRYGSDPVAWRGTGNALAGLGAYNKALIAFQRANQLRPQPATYISKGDVLLKLNRLQDASDAYKQALALDKQSCLAYLGLREALELQGRTQEAQQISEIAKQLGCED